MKQRNSVRRALPAIGVNRGAAVVACLLSAMALTSGLLLAMRTKRLNTQAQSLFAVDTSDSLDSIFNLNDASPTQRWSFIYIHQSATASGSAVTLANSDGSLGDHFVIGNGEGSGDGELLIDQRWTHQQPAAAPAGVHLGPQCVSISLVGNLDQQPPTPLQFRRLCQLVQVLQSRYHISPDNVSWFTNSTRASATIGRCFPAQRFDAQLLGKQTFAR